MTEEKKKELLSPAIQRLLDTLQESGHIKKLTVRIEPEGGKSGYWAVGDEMFISGDTQQRRDNVAMHELVHGLIRTRESRIKGMEKKLRELPPWMWDEIVWPTSWTEGKMPSPLWYGNWGGYTQSPPERKHRTGIYDVFASDPLMDMAVKTSKSRVDQFRSGFDYPMRLSGVPGQMTEEQRKESGMMWLPFATEEESMAYYLTTPDYLLLKQSKMEKREERLRELGMFMLDRGIPIGHVEDILDELKTQETPWWAK